MLRQSNTRIMKIIAGESCAVAKTEFWFLHIKQFGFPLISGNYICHFLCKVDHGTWGVVVKKFGNNKLKFELLKMLEQRVRSEVLSETMIVLN